jgi:hypothetical protein
MIFLQRMIVAVRSANRFFSRSDQRLSLRADGFGSTMQFRTKLSKVAIGHVPRRGSMFSISY